MNATNEAVADPSITGSRNDDYYKYMYMYDRLPPLPLPLLLAAVEQANHLTQWRRAGLAPSEFEALPSLGIQRAERIKRSALKEKCGPTIGRFREPTGNIAAIEFGTTFCSLAFTTEKSKANIWTHRLYGCHFRIPTAILLKQNEHCSDFQRNSGNDGLRRSPVYYVRSLGYEAQNDHGKRFRIVDRLKCLYFEEFKINESVHRNSVITASNGTKCYLVEVIAFILRYLKDQLDSHLKNAPYVTVTIDSFDWVITVPAIWRSREKRLMREAAYLAGLCSADKCIDRFIEVGCGIPRPEEKNPDKLTLIPEPEAAAIYCQTMNAQHIPEYCRVNGSVRSDHYLVIDIRQDTIDITAHHHNKEQGIEVIAEPIGNDCGGMKVNREFSKLLQKIVNDESDDPNKEFSRFITSHDPGVVLTRKATINSLLNIKFELAKVQFGSKASGLDPSALGYEDEISVDLPNEFVQFYSLRAITSGVAALKDRRIELDETTLFMKASFVQDLFQPAVTGILNCVRSVLDRLQNDIDTIYLLGDFGSCKYIYEKIFFLVKANFPNVRVVVPKDHSLAVAQGAVKYRLNPNIIHSRVMDATYGISICSPFVADQNDKKYFIGFDSRGIPLRRDVFLHYVDKGETISCDEIVTYELVPLSDTSTQMKIDIFSTFDPDAEYIKDEDEKPIPTIRKIGEIQIDLPNEESLPWDKRVVELTMDFCSSEIQVRARSIGTGVEVKTTLDFLTDFN